MRPIHALHALHGVAAREVLKFFQQQGRLWSALVRPALWLLVFAAGFRSVFEFTAMAPYPQPVDYQVYIVPGLCAMVLLFNGMQSSLAMVYDREMGMMRLLLTAPLPRWYLLFCKLCAGTVLSVLQVYAFLLIAWLAGSGLPWWGWLTVLPALVLSGMMLGALGLLLAVFVKQLENFAGTMNFVIFPLFFISTALNPLARFRESGAAWVYRLAEVNPFTHAVELIRFAAYGEFAGVACAVVAGSLAGFFGLAVVGYDPQRGLLRRSGRPG